jgi:hypothetical protein
MWFQIIGKPLPNQSPNKRQLEQNQEGQQKRQVVKNDNINLTFALTPEDEWKVFIGSETAEKRPAFGKKKICHKWHMKGYCFSDYANTASHCQWKDLSPDRQQGLTDWIVTCREQGKVTKNE